MGPNPPCENDTLCGDWRGRCPKPEDFLRFLTCGDWRGRCPKTADFLKDETTLKRRTVLQTTLKDKGHLSSVVSSDDGSSFVGNSQKVREGTCVIHCVPRSPAKPIREARQHSHRGSHFAKPLRGLSALCAIMASVLHAFHGSSMPKVDV